MSSTPRRDIVVIGASSAGGVIALRQLAAELPFQFPAGIAVVLHIGANRSVLPTLLAQDGPNPAAHAQDGGTLRPGHWVIAPPDRHLVISDGFLRLTHSPKEHFTRPAIDCLFRSAAFVYGPRVIGVLLTGYLHDGTAGLQAIKQGGGLVIVQDPRTASAASMPAHALEHVVADYCLPPEQIGRKLVELVPPISPRSRHSKEP